MAFAQASSETGGAAALGLHEELSHPAVLRCVCGPRNLLLRSSHGELVRPRGGCVNRCAYCAKLAAVENSEMLALDALEGDPPAVWMVLGTRTPFPVLPGECECSEDGGRCERCTLLRGQMAGFYDGLRLAKRALRRRWPGAEYAAMLEFTTGYAATSSGLRRPHWNLLVKGVPAADAKEAGEVAARIWCRHVDAEPAAQFSGSIYAAGGLMRYMAQHFQKASQEPPEGFTGQRFNCSLAYFTGCTRAVARRRAKEALAIKRELWKAQRVDADAYDVELRAHEAHQRSLSTVWTLASATGSRLGTAIIDGAPTRRSRNDEATARRVERLRALRDGDMMPARDLALFPPGMSEAGT